MIYLDSSSPLKLFHDEPESAGVRRAVAAESDVIVSTLAQVEALVHFKAGWLGGDYGKARYQAYVERFEALGEIVPFRFAGLSGSVFLTAIRQDWSAGSHHVRVLDRLHLAAMEELKVRRLMTNDANQATAARALGWVVVTPG
ncbi:MAG TPA: type II toxin-antitoxin system VapC family toxin [Candidatus Saccharimonadales bacterium]|nr:type II toxin-antitoxin system VapC family toxin [Candidatus Saccharimonadales bacterium]